MATLQKNSAEVPHHGSAFAHGGVVSLHELDDCMHSRAKIASGDRARTPTLPAFPQSPCQPSPTRKETRFGLRNRFGLTIDAIWASRIAVFWCVMVAATAQYV